MAQTAETSQRWSFQEEQEERRRRAGAAASSSGLGQWAALHEWTDTSLQTSYWAFSSFMFFGGGGWGVTLRWPSFLNRCKPV